ncbi:MAG: acetyltransferase [Bacteroidota bacterium]|nr:acetyltransferase [Bacteroidota bacterium]
MEIIISESLKLRPWCEEDKQELQRIANNSNVTKYLRERFPHPYTKNDAERWVSLNIMGLHETHFCIEYNGKPAGGIGIDIQNDIHKYTAEMGYWLGEEYWNKGIVTQCIQTVTPFFINKFQLKRIYATASVGNVASIKALERAGYTFEGTMKNYAHKDGVDLDGTLYAFTK